MKELQDKDGWLIEWRPTRSGRKVTGLRFDFKRNPQQHFNLDIPLARQLNSALEPV